MPGDEDANHDDGTRPVYAASDEPLVCVVCGRESVAGEIGWRAFLGGRFGDDSRVGIYCPECAAREFGS